MKMGEDVRLSCKRKDEISVRQRNNAAHRIWLVKRIDGLIHLAVVGSHGF